MVEPTFARQQRFGQPSRPSSEAQTASTPQITPTPSERRDPQVERLETEIATLRGSIEGYQALYDEEMAKAREVRATITDPRRKRGQLRDIERRLDYLSGRLKKDRAALKNTREALQRTLKGRPTTPGQVASETRQYVIEAREDREFRSEQAAQPPKPEGPSPFPRAPGGKVGQLQPADRNAELIQRFGSPAARARVERADSARFQSQTGFSRTQTGQRVFVGTGRESAEDLLRIAQAQAKAGTLDRPSSRAPGVATLSDRTLAGIAGTGQLRGRGVQVVQPPVQGEFVGPPAPSPSVLSVYRQRQRTTRQQINADLAALSGNQISDPSFTLTGKSLNIGGTRDTASSGLFGGFSERSIRARGTDDPRRLQTSPEIRPFDLVERGFQKVTGIPDKLIERSGGDPRVQLLDLPGAVFYGQQKVDRNETPGSITLPVTTSEAADVGSFFIPYVGAARFGNLGAGFATSFTTPEGRQQAQDYPLATTSSAVLFGSGAAQTGPGLRLLSKAESPTLKRAGARTAAEVRSVASEASFQAGVVGREFSRTLTQLFSDRAGRAGKRPRSKVSRVSYERSTGTIYGRITGTAVKEQGLKYVPFKARARPEGLQLAVGSGKEIRRFRPPGLGQVPKGIPRSQLTTGAGRGAPLPRAKSARPELSFVAERIRSGSGSRGSQPRQPVNPAQFSGGEQLLQGLTKRQARRLRGRAKEARTQGSLKNAGLAGDPALLGRGALDLRPTRRVRAGGREYLIDDLIPVTEQPGQLPGGFRQQPGEVVGRAARRRQLIEQRRSRIKAARAERFRLAEFSRIARQRAPLNLSSPIISLGQRSSPLSIQAIEQGQGNLLGSRSLLSLAQAQSPVSLVTPILGTAQDQAVAQDTALRQDTDQLLAFDTLTDVFPGPTASTSESEYTPRPRDTRRLVPITPPGFDFRRDRVPPEEEPPRRGLFDFDIPDLEEDRKRKRSRKRGSRRGRYAPDLTALFQGFASAEVPGVFTGLERRPIRRANKRRRR